MADGPAEHKDIADGSSSGGSGDAEMDSAAASPSTSSLPAEGGQQWRWRWRRVALVVLPRLMFFCSTAALSTSTPFFAPYYLAHGYGADVIGVFLAFDPVVALVATAAIMALADRARSHTAFLVVSIAVIIVAAVSVRWTVPVSMWATFASLLAIALMKATYWNSVTTTVVVLFPDFGRIRLFGSLGWGSTGVVLGFATRAWGLGVIWFVFPVFYALIAISALGLHCVAPL
jgi:hypothetical protein